MSEAITLENYKVAHSTKKALKNQYATHTLPPEKMASSIYEFATQAADNLSSPRVHTPTGPETNSIS